jgi:hypothetical protein
VNDAACARTSAHPGDASADGSVNIADPVAIPAHLFQDTYLPCPAAAEVNEDGRLNLADAAYILQNLFAAGPPLPAPGLRPCT